ncbi:MAG: hypothetical protein IJ753_07440 [Bacteroidales bacterium]|nr:hypothetical protein [Bacteroidales bacterium]
MDELIILVSTCDKAKICWAPFIAAFNKAWPDCPYKRYFVTNYLDVEDKIGGFRAIPVGEDKGWATNLKSALKHIPEDVQFFLYMQEDFWLTAPVHTDFVKQELSFCKKNSIASLRLTCPWLDLYRIDERHALSPVGLEPYALCLSAGIWNKFFFEQLLVSGWTGWDFEEKVAAMVETDTKSFVLLENVSQQEFRLIGLAGGAVRRGRWTREAARYLKNNGYSHLVMKRSVEGPFYTGLLSFARINKYTRIMASRIIVLMHRKKINI